MKPHPSQGDLFGDAVYPSRTASQSVDAARFRSKLKREMARAIRQCPHDRHIIALRMAQILGIDTFSKATLDAYTAESKETHDISMVRFAAFVRATGATWLFTYPARLDGSRECFERSVGGQVRHVVLLLSARSSFPDQPDLLAWHALNAIVGHPVFVAIGNSHAACREVA